MPLVSADRSSRPLWLGPVTDQRGWDHARLHKQLLLDTRLAATDGPAKSIVLAVYFGLAMHAEVDTGCSRPSVETLASYAGCNERSVRRAFVVLEEVGYVELRRRKGKAAIVVLLPPPELPEEALVQVARDTERQRDTLDPQSRVEPAEEIHTPDRDDRQPGPSRPTPRTESPTNESQEREPGTRASAVDVDLSLHLPRGGLGEGEGEQIIASVGRTLTAADQRELYNPKDARCRTRLAAEIDRLLADGWHPDDLELALHGPMPDEVRSPAGVLLTRCRDLRRTLDREAAHGPASAEQRETAAVQTLARNLGRSDVDPADVIAAIARAATTPTVLRAGLNQLLTFGDRHDLAEAAGDELERLGAVPCG